jgi:hypothetical protein
MACGLEGETRSEDRILPGKLMERDRHFNEMEYQDWGLSKTYVVSTGEAWARVLAHLHITHFLKKQSF